MLSSVKAIVDSGVEINGSLVFASVCDEEYASIGTEKLMEDIIIDAAVVGEPTGLDILIAHKGFAWIDIETHGIAAHGSAWDEGVDAIAKMGKVQVGLEELMHEKLKKKKHKLLGYPSVHASTIQGGRELSTYPDYCKLQVERRLIPGEDKDDLDVEISKLLSSIGQLDPDFNANYKVTFFRGPMEISRDANICKMLRKCCQQVTGRSPNYIGGSYWLDTQIIWQHGVPVVAFGPKGVGLHAAVEYVEVDSVVENARVLELLIKNFSKEK
jgi:acetylornithine deacetylase